uniref:Uncharacterized protein n=1 Tax=Brassica oleracea var. oleracea TaxID=109376 RepID=A0A0D3AXH3_BRAOL
MQAKGRSSEITYIHGFEQVFPRTQVWKKEITRDVDGVSEKRGGRVQLEPMVIPQSEFDYADTGDVLMLSMPWSWLYHWRNWSMRSSYTFSSSKMGS